MKSTTKILGTAAAVYLAVMGAESLSAKAAWVKQAKDAGFPATNCLYCHTEKLPKKEQAKEQLNDRLYGIGEEVGPNAIEVFVHRLRRKTESSGVVIRTIRGLGYLVEKPARVNGGGSDRAPALSISPQEQERVARSAG